MTEIRKLKGITVCEAGILELHKIRTVEQLWICVGNGESEIDRIGTLIGDKNRLINLLTDEGLRQSRSLGDSWIARHWLDVTLIFTLTVLTVFIVGAIRARSPDSTPPATIQVESGGD